MAEPTEPKSPANAEVPSAQAAIAAAMQRVAVTGFIMWWKRRNPTRKKKVSGSAAVEEHDTREEVAELAVRRVQDA